MHDIENDTKVMEILKVTQARHVLAWTDKGELGLLLRKGEKKYSFMLDSVPCDEETSKRLSKAFPTLASK